MDRLAGDLDGGDPSMGDGDVPIGANGDGALGETAQDALARSFQRRALPQPLFGLDQLDVLYDPEHAVLWTYMAPTGRPSFTPSMLADFEDWQRLISESFGPGRIPLRYLVLGSRSPGVFCFGGDLELFHALIRDGDRQGLANYGYRCVEILERNIRTLELPMLTIGLVQGQALGGGFEALLSFDFIIAERGSSFGLPEVMFGLFPGMGAHPILSRKLGSAMADRLILGNRTYSAEDMYDLGIVHELAEPGEGEAAVRRFIAQSERRHGGLVNARRASRAAAPIPMSEFRAIVDLWADAALQLREHDLKLMQRLASAQQKLAQAS